MGIVYETSNIHNDLTAWQNLMFTAELYDIRKAEREKWGRDPIVFIHIFQFAANRLYKKFNE